MGNDSIVPGRAWLGIHISALCKSREAFCEYYDWGTPGSATNPPALEFPAVAVNGERWFLRARAVLFRQCWTSTVNDLLSVSHVIRGAMRNKYEAAVLDRRLVAHDAILGDPQAI